MIDHGDLRKDWEWVRPGIEIIRKRNKAAWLAEDLYSEVRADMASLFVNEERDSFIIIRAIRDGYTGETGIKILACYVAVGRDREELEAEFLDMLSLKGANPSFMEAESKRQGFSRIGWDIEKIIYRKRL